MSNRICQIRTCSEHALWQVKTTGHPNTNGELTEVYCQEHLRIPAWPESPTQYKIEVTGPLQTTSAPLPPKGA